LKVILISILFVNFQKGIALGLEGQLRGTIALFLGILIHKIAEAFAMGISFVKADTKKKYTLPLTVVFALIVPIGVAIGLGLTSAGTFGVIFAALLGSFASGNINLLILF
jgi:zinc transporter ZupT